MTINNLVKTVGAWNRRYLPKAEQKVFAGSVAATDYFESTVGPHTVGQAMKRSCLQKTKDG